MAPYTGDMSFTPNVWDLPDLVPGDERAPHEQIADAVRRAIVDGRLRLRQRVPGQPVVARRYRVGEYSVRRAFDLLVAEGVLRNRYRLGHFVCGPVRERT